MRPDDAPPPSAAELPVGRPQPGQSASLARLEALIEAHHRQALGVAYQLLGNVADAEAVAQEALLAVWRHGPTVDPPAVLTRVWVLRFVRHGAIDLLRAPPRRHASAARERLSRADQPDGVGLGGACLAGTTVCWALACLPPEQRHVMELVYFGGRSDTELAAHLSLPLGTVRARLRATLDRLRQALSLGDSRQR